ncbi:protein NETWORKED 2D-like [Prosopis cineraria]|uniref:protein NETWORKED 2D-like n=1 Tax=Prosopis cineraria TaxID=364024 RepID=UPI00240F6881|nr:protein NETWORKED 2D-like [Prosopis cineraria]
MLQRAASNAYSWWWASHIRTKQSKWMEQHLQDFQEKVEVVMKLLQEDGDSFAKRAEMYYKGRPELINFVEESYRAYRALAERYDHISKELQNANNTIASICPEQVPFMEEDYEDGSPKAPRKAPGGLKPSNAAPKVPKPPRKDLKTVISSATKKFCTKKVVTKTSGPKERIKSGLNKKEALEEIDKLQKQILTLQTVKEFVKSTYDNAIQKYWDTEEEIKGLQERVSLLQDEFGEGMVIEDDVARRLMTEAALKTCQETLARLRVKQERSFDETKIETKRVKAVREKLESLMHKLHYDDQISRTEPRARKNVKQIVKDLDEDIERMNQQRQELQLLQNQIKEQLATGSSASGSVTEMAEKIDELVNKVISLETSVSSHDALVTRLKAETDDLQSQIVTLEDDKAAIDEKNDLTTKLREMDEKMMGIQDLNEMVETQNTDLQSNFTKVLCDLDHLSEDVPNVKPDKRDEIPDSSKRESESSGVAVSEHVVQRQDAVNQENVLINDSESEKKPKVSGSVDNDMQKENKIGVGEFADNNVQIENKINDLGLGDNDVQKENKIEVADFSDNDVQKDNKINDIGLRDNNVQKDEETNVTALVDNDVKKDNEIKVTDSLENGAKSHDKLKVMESSEKAEASSTGGLSPFNAIKSHLTNVIALTPMKPKEQEKNPNTGNSDALARSASSITSGDQDLSQQKEGEKANSNSESSGKQQERNATQSSSNTENADEVHSQEQVAALVDNDVKKDNEIKVSDSLENEAKSDDKLKVMESSEKVEASSTGGQSPFNVIRSHLTNFIALTPMKPKEQEKTPNTSNSDTLARSASSITARDQDLSQHKETEEANSNSEQEKNATQSSSKTENAREVHSQEQVTAEEDEPNWRQLFMDGMKDKEKLLLTEYTNILRNYKEMKKTLSELEKQNQEILFDTSLKLKEMKSSTTLKDEEIKLLRRKLGLMERSLEGNEDSEELRAIKEPVKKEEEEDDDDVVKILKVHQPDSTSAIEEKFRRRIDELLEENLGFWLKFSTTFTEIQRFQTTIRDLQSDVSKLEENGKSESVRQSVKSEARPIFKHLVEIQTELSVWLEKSASLKEELQHRSSSLCGIQEEITKALKASAEDYDFKFTSYQAAKFQGEVLNMKQENKKVADELQAGLDHVSALQSEVEKVLAKMGEDFGFTSSKKQQNTEMRHSDSSGSDSGRGNRSQVPLGAFIFGVKPKKQKHSIFSGISPGMHKKCRAAMKGHYL